MFRTVFLSTMILSFFGLGAVDCLAKNWRTGVASMLLGIVQLLVFWRAIK